MKQKLAIVISGGGMLAGYNSGILYTLIKKYKLENPDLYLGGSAGAIISCYGVANQPREGKNIWYKRLCNKKCINSKRFWKIFDVDYLIDKIVLQQEKLDIKKIINSKIKILISAINRATGKIEYFSSKKCKNLPLVIKASMAIPFAYPKKIKINGKKYEDGSNSVKVDLKIQKAIKEGANKIIVIDSGAKMPPWALKTFLFLRSKKFRKGFYEDFEQRKNKTSNKNVEIVTLAPKEKWGQGVLDNRKEMLIKGFEKGCKDATDNKELKKFLSKLDKRFFK